MINSDDPVEWAEQVKLNPESGPNIVRTLTSRLKGLDETNEKLRNEIISLEEKIDTNAHQNEVSELVRQIRGLVRIIKSQESLQSREKGLLIWSDNGYFSLILPKDLIKGGAIYLTNPRGSRKIKLLSIEIFESILVVTSSGKCNTFDVKDLPIALPNDFKWHVLPELNLSTGEDVSFISPIAKLPLCDSFITISRGGFARSLMRLSMDQLLQSGQFGKGVKDNKDSPGYGVLVSNKKSEIILFTNKGNYARFSVDNLTPSPIQALKLGFDEEIVSVLSCDIPDQKLLFIDSNAKVLQNELKNLAISGIGLKPKMIMKTDALIGVSTNNNSPDLILLSKTENSLIINGFKTINFFPPEKTKRIIDLSAIEGNVFDFSYL